MFLATVVDCRMREVIGWVMALIENAIRMGAGTICLDLGVIFHSDCTSTHLSKTLKSLEFASL